MSAIVDPLIIICVAALVMLTSAMIFRKLTDRRPKPAMVTVVTADDGFTVIDRRAKLSVTVAWARVTRVTVITTDKGPFIDDVFYHMIYDGGEVTVPSEAEGAAAFVAGLQALPGFDMAAFGAAISSTQNNSFAAVLGK